MRKIIRYFILLKRKNGCDRAIVKYLLRGWHSSHKVTKNQIMVRWILITYNFLLQVIKIFKTFKCHKCSNIKNAQMSETFKCQKHSNVTKAQIFLNKGSRGSSGGLISNICNRSFTSWFLIHRCFVRTFLIICIRSYVFALMICWRIVALHSITLILISNV